jgi:hypothetical protein
MTEPAEGLAALRAPFNPSTVGKLPRVTCKACSNSASKHCDKHERKDCAVCGNWISTQHIHLDYVGHAEVTDRLLSVDPAWTWEPFAVGDDGLPVVKKGASGEWELWIKLTVCGVTRIGVGSVSTGFDAEKQLIGDALRNAAMRFGVALDLWAKSELESASDDTPIAGPPPPAPTPAQKARAEFGEKVRQSPCRDQFKKWAKEQGFPDTPSPFTDEQLAKASEWLVFAESAHEHDQQTEQPPLPLGDTPSADNGRMDDRAAAAARYVKGLDQVALLVQFTSRKLKAPRAVGEQRVALAAALVADESWVPPAQETLV